MFTNKKGQASIEIIIIIVFLILFLYVFNNMADSNAKTLEVNKIKEQEQEIALALNNFLKLQESILGDAAEKYNIVDYNSTFRIPSIQVPSQKLSCEITVSDTSIGITADYKGESIDYSYATSLSTNKYNLPITINCNQILTCLDNSYKLECT